MRTRITVRSDRAGITLTEILIGIMILGIGLISLATLFPIGLVRLREAQRQTRSAYLSESVASDVESRGLFNANSFVYADLLNAVNGLPAWFFSRSMNASYNPLIQDTPYYGGDPFEANPNTPPIPPFLPVGAAANTSGGYGLPFAYDPLWRYQTGIYLDPVNLSMPEVRFAAGNFINSASQTVSTLRPDPSDGGLASAWGLQRLTNFNRPYPANPSALVAQPAIMAQASQVPAIFVSPEDVVWNENTQGGTAQASVTQATPYFSPGYSPVLPDLSISNVATANGFQPVSTSDWRFTWMITAQQTNTTNGASFDGNIVVFENRPFSIDNGQVSGETVVEAVYGASTNVMASGGGANVGYGAGADRTVLLRWFATLPDPVVKVGDWIADVTYERNQNTALSRFFQPGGPPYIGWSNPLHNLEWDNLPAQRCYWYQIQKVNPPQSDPTLGATYRSMTVYVNRTLEAKTLLTPGNGQPIVLNAALICPYVVNVIPQTFFVR